MPTTLTVWHSWSGAKLTALSTIARSFEQANPDVRIALQSQSVADMVRQYTASVADGMAPQIVLLPGRYVGELAAQQYLAPLDTPFDTPVLSDIVPEALDSVRVDDRLYGVPLSFDALVLFYDRRYVATPPASFDELLQLNAAAREQPPEERPLSTAYHLSPETTLPYLPSFGGGVLGPDGTAGFASGNREATSAWLQWLQGLQTDPNIAASPDFSAVDAAIQAGRAWSAVDWSYRHANYAQVWGADSVGVAALPSRGGQPAPTVVLPQVLALNPVSTPAQRSAAHAFLRFAIEPASQEILASRGGLLPSNRGASLDPAQQPLMAAVEHAQTLSSGMTVPAVWRPFSDLFRSVIAGTTPPAEALDSAAASLQSASP